MSENEKRKRQNYKIRRTRWMIVQLALILLVALAITACALTYYTLDKTYYIEYTEKSNVDYRVNYFPNDEYGDWVDDGKSYINELTKAIEVTFGYELDMVADVEYEYRYRIDAELEIFDEVNQLPIYSPVYTLVPESDASQTSNRHLAIYKSVLIDFDTFDQTARSFIRTYQLRDVRSTLIATMYIDVTGSSDAFESSAENSYQFSVNIPLTETTYSLFTSESIPTGENKVLACKEALNQHAFRLAAILLGVLDALLILVLIAFIFLTRNDDINYSIKIKRILSSYGSFIQRITNPFDERGHKLLLVRSFNEMLGIRDTIQSPILMNENEDQTSTKFYIPTNTSLLYVFEIRVEGYDDLYAERSSESIAEAPNTDALREDTSVAEVTQASEILREVEAIMDAAPQTESVAAEVAVTVPCEEETVNEPFAESTERKTLEDTVKELSVMADIAEQIPNEEVPNEEIPNEEIPDEEIPDEEIPDEEEALDDESAEEENGEMVSTHDDNVRIINDTIVHIRYKTSFTSRLIQAGEVAQDYYTVLKNTLLSYKGVKAKPSWAYESFTKGRIPCAKLNVRGASVLVYLGLDPAEYPKEAYRCKNVGDRLKFSKVPMMIRVKGPNNLKLACKLIGELMAKLGIPKKAEIPNEDYRMPYETKEALVERGLVKVIYPEGIVIDENTVIRRFDVGEHLRSLRGEDTPSSPVTADIRAEGVKILEQSIKPEELAEALAEPTSELETIDYVDEIDEAYEQTEEHPGVEVIGVVWPERAHKSKIYRYDPSGEVLDDGDIVLVPTRDAARDREVIRKAAVAHGNHVVNPDTLKHPLKKIIGIVRRKLTKALSDDE